MLPSTSKSKSESRVSVTLCLRAWTSVLQPAASYQRDFYGFSTSGLPKCRGILNPCFPKFVNSWTEQGAIIIHPLLYIMEDGHHRREQNESVTSELMGEDDMVTVSLHEVLASRSLFLEEREFWALCRECCLTLEYVHDCHDLFQSLCISPDTVAFDPEGNVCFLDLDMGEYTFQWVIVGDCQGLLLLDKELRCECSSFQSPYYSYFSESPSSWLY